MKYKYPKITNTLIYKRIDDNSVEITDRLTDNSFIFDNETARYVKCLDGHTNPYKIESPFNRAEIDDIIKFLDYYDLTRKNNTISVSFGTKLRTLWIPKITVKLKLLAYLYNILLMILWLPIAIIGIVAFIKSIESTDFNLAWMGYFIGIVCGMIFHEVGHAFAGMSYGAKVFEMGIMVMYCVLPGAYVLLDCRTVKNRLKRIQIYAAGVESNFLLFGVFLLLAASIHSLGGLFLNAAISNVFMGVINLTFIDGLDGTTIVSELLGVDDVIGRAKKIVFNQKKREKLLLQGLNGYATVSMCYILTILQISMPVLLLTNILEIVLCIV